MITRDSILRRLPPNLDRRQALFIDGIRHAAEIATLAYGRLGQTLTQIATHDDQGADADNLYTAAFLDAWSLVGVIDRFRTLCSLLPYATHTPVPPPPGKKSFAELTQPIRDLRNVADHLAVRADYVVARRGAALGTLSWFTALRPDGLVGVICTIIPGTIQSSSTPIVNPAGREIELPTGLIHLAAGEYKANLSEIIPQMALRIKHTEEFVERGLAKAGVEGGKQAVRDLLIKMFVSG
jgi:hypothetical protein